MRFLWNDGVGGSLSSMSETPDALRKLMDVIELKRGLRRWALRACGRRYCESDGDGLSEYGVVKQGMSRRDGTVAPRLLGYIRFPRAASVRDKCRCVRIVVDSGVSDGKDEEGVFILRVRIV